MKLGAGIALVLFAGSVAAADLKTGPVELREVELRNMQKTNPEWDFMSRTFFVLALANMSLRDPAVKPQALEIMDAAAKEVLPPSARTELDGVSREFRESGAALYVTFLLALAALAIYVAFIASGVMQVRG